MRKRPYIISAIVILILLWYYFIYRAFPVNLGFVDSVVAFSAMILITFSFLLGPVARFVPLFKKQLIERKDYGLIGFSLAALHTVLIVFKMISETDAITFGAVVSIVFAGIAFIVFLLMAVTSTKKWVKLLGYTNWKNLQRTGYLALLFVAFHVVLLENGVFLNRLTGQVAIGLILVTLLLRGIVLILRIPGEKKIEV